MFTTPFYVYVVRFLSVVSFQDYDSDMEEVNEEETQRLKVKYGLLSPKGSAATAGVATTVAGMDEADSDADESDIR